MQSLLALALSVLPASRPELGEFPPEARERGVAATVKVVCPADGAWGSGVIVARGGPHTYVLTAHHVVAGGRTAEVRVAPAAGGPKAEVTHRAEVLARSPEADLALLRMPAGDGLPAPLAIARGEARPSSAVSVGWEKGDRPSAREEAVTGKVRIRRPGQAGSVSCWETTRKPAAGRSGGPLLDETGRLIGLASGHDGAAGYYVHAEEIHAFLRQNGLRWIADDR
jgi:S1-C subfamily serine protease